MPRKNVDWPALRKLFEQTDMSVASIARLHGVSRPAIDKRAEKEGWTVSPAREELKARAVGGSNISEKPSEPTSGIPREEISPSSWRRARELYEGTRMPLHKIAADVQISETDIDFKIAEQGWSRFGSSHAQPSRTAEYRDSAMRDPATGDAAPSAAHAALAEPIERMRVDPDPARVRSPVRKLSRRDEKPIELSAARRVKPNALVAILRDAGEALCCQIRDAIGNRDSLMDMLDEWNDDNPDKIDKYEAMKAALGLKELSLVLKNTANALKSLADQDQAGTGKKERQNNRAKEIAEGTDGGDDAPSPFRQRRGGTPKLAADGGERV